MKKNLQLRQIRFLMICFLGVLIPGISLAQNLPVKFSFTRIGQEVFFQDKTTLTEVGREWTFGDGASDTVKNPTHFYSDPGQYFVTLKVFLQGGAELSYSYGITIEDLSELYQLHASIPVGSGNHEFDVLKHDGITDVANHTLSIINNTPYHASAFSVTSDKKIDYTPDPAYVGSDVIEYEICNTTTSDCDTGFVYIETYEGDCGYHMELHSSGEFCPHDCTPPGSNAHLPAGQPKNGGCWGYVFVLENYSQEDVTELDAVVEIDPHMGLNASSGQVFNLPHTNSDAIEVNFDSVNNRVFFSMAPGHTLAPGEVFHYHFTVDVLSNPPGGPGEEYHTLLEGFANCASGSGIADTTTIKDNEGGACDPNEIDVVPLGCGPTGIIDQKVDQLTYKISFENIGTGPATEVMIADILPKSLDINTIQIIDGVPFRPQMAKNSFIDSQLVQFFFHDINLPPTSQDSIGSHGYVKFTIDVKQDWADSTVVENWADVFFDQQPPVRTDTTINTLIIDALPVSNLVPDLYLLPGQDTCVFASPSPTGGSGSYTYSWTGGFSASSLTICPFATGNMSLWITDAATGCVTYDRWNYTFLEPEPAKALNFDGIDDYVIGTEGFVYGEDARTIEGWVKIPGPIPPTSGWASLMMSYGSTGASGEAFGFGVHNTGKLFFWGHDLDYMGNDDIADDTWHHIALTFDSLGTMTFYIDGVVDATHTIAPGTLNTTSNTFFTMGTRMLDGAIDTTWNFQGSMDDVRVWAYSRTAEQISQNMNCYIDSTESGIISNYKFDHGMTISNNAADTIAVNGIGTLMDGTLKNFALEGLNSNWTDGANIANTCWLTDIEDFISPKAGLIIAPNPAIDVLNLRLEAKKNAQMTLYVFDVSGRMIMSKNEQAVRGHQELSIDINHLSSGIYFLKVQIGEDHYSKKFIKSN